jgi:hypothetical protein
MRDGSSTSFVVQGAMRQFCFIVVITPLYTIAVFLLGFKTFVLKISKRRNFSSLL